MARQRANVTPSALCSLALAHLPDPASASGRNQPGFAQTSSLSPSSRLPPPLRLLLVRVPATTTAMNPLSPLALPSTAHRATGAPAIQVNTARQGPRPTHTRARSQSATTRHPTSAQTRHLFTPCRPATRVRVYVDRPGRGAQVSPALHSLFHRPAFVGGNDQHDRIDAHGSLSYVSFCATGDHACQRRWREACTAGNGGKAQLVKVPSLKRKPARRGRRTTRSAIQVRRTFNPHPPTASVRAEGRGRPPSPHQP